VRGPAKLYRDAAKPCRAAEKKLTTTPNRAAYAVGRELLLVRTRDGRRQQQQQQKEQKELPNSCFVPPSPRTKITKRTKRTQFCSPLSERASACEQSSERTPRTATRGGLLLVREARCLGTGIILKLPAASRNSSGMSVTRIGEARIVVESCKIERRGGSLFTGKCWKTETKI